MKFDLETLYKKDVPYSKRTFKSRCIWNEKVYKESSSPNIKAAVIFSHATLFTELKLVSTKDKETWANTKIPLPTLKLKKERMKLKRKLTGPSKTIPGTKTNLS